MRKQFYEKALPTQGVYCAAGISKDGIVRHRFAESIDNLMITVESLKREGLNVYVTPNSFTGHSRKADYASFSRSFFVDLDVNHGSVCYTSKQEALDALSAFVSDADLPPPVRIDSGTGIHAYWLFEEDVPVYEWQVYAQKFKEYCNARGLKIDPAVTADASRIMRCPSTLNYKTNSPTEARLLDNEFFQYDFSLFKELLGVSDVTTPIDSILSVAVKGLDSNSLAFKDNFEYVFEDIAILSLEGKGCNQIKYILEEAKTVREPLWYAGLSIAVRCVDGPEAIHLMSEDHPGYSRENTDRKARQSIDNAKWAHSCSAFEKENPAACIGCVHKGSLRSRSPIDLGRRFAEADAEKVSTEDAIRIDEDPQTLSVFPNDLRPFVRGRAGGVFYMPMPDADGERDDPVCLVANDLYPIKRLIAGSDKECLLMRHILPHDPINDFLLPLKHVYTFDKLRQMLAENGVNFDISQTPKLHQYLTKWDTYLQRKEKAEIMRKQMGWTEDKDAFVLGDIEIGKDGNERPTAASPMIKNVAKLVRRVGSYDLWKASAKALNAPGFEIHALGLLQGFGSVLMHLTSTPGSSICYQSTDSGVGKTGALYAGLSVFCDPYNISILEGVATDNAHIGRYLALKNIMFGLDEASNISGEALSKILHRISQGKAKLRMQSSVDAERDLEMSASMQGGFTSNQSLYDKLFAFKSSPQGELARLIEFSMKKPPQMEADPTIGNKIFDVFRTNYGWAGPEFVKYLYKVGDAYVSKVLTKWVLRFTKDYGGQSEYRFYMNTIAANFAGGELANEAGITELELDRIYDVVILNMIQIRDKTVKPAMVDYQALISEFYYKNLQSFLIFDHDRIVAEPKGSHLVGRFESAMSRVYLHKSEFKKFLNERQISSREFEVTLEKDKVLLGTEKRRLSSGWRTGTGATPSITVYVFASKLDVPDAE